MSQLAFEKDLSAKLGTLRAFPMASLKFKLKFSLRPYFFYFSLSLFKTLTSDSLFSTLFHLNIHYYYYFFSSTPKISFFPIFLLPLPLFRCIFPPFFFSPPPTYHFFSLSFFFFFPFKNCFLLKGTRVT